MSAPIVVSLLLRSDCNSDAKRDALRVAVGDLGMTVRSEGQAAWTVSIERSRFEELFGVEAIGVSARAPGDRDKGAPPGFAAKGEPVVPSLLEPYVERAGVEPPPTRLGI